MNSNESTNLRKHSISIKLSFPVINVTTFETTRAALLYSELAESTGKSYMEMPFKELPDSKSLERLIKNAGDSWNSNSNDKKFGDNGIVIFDHFFFERQAVNKSTVPALKQALVFLEENGINYVIAGKGSLNEEFVYHCELPPIDDEATIELIKECEETIGGKSHFNDKERQMIANHGKGLSYTQMRNVFTYCAYLKHKNEPYLNEIRDEKAHILKDVGLDVIETISMDQVGGLNRVKEFLRVRKSGWDNDMPVKGILLAGVPGGGKTLIAKAAADTLGTTLVRLDMSRFYSKYLGETERQFERGLKTIEAISPVVVLIDEIEKFFGAGNGGDHEVSKRLLGQFLYWLQERKEKVFIVATANRVHSLPPELIRSGRWDKAFFIDIPTSEERKTIFEIHLKRVTEDLTGIDLSVLVARSEGYTGAEIEQAIVDARYLGVDESRSLDTDLVVRSLEAISPTSKTRKADIDAIRDLKNQGFYPANEEENISSRTFSRKVANV